MFLICENPGKNPYHSGSYFYAFPTGFPEILLFGFLYLGFKKLEKALLSRKTEIKNVVLLTLPVTWSKTTHIKRRMTFYKILIKSAERRLHNIFNVNKPGMLLLFDKLKTISRHVYGK